MGNWPAQASELLWLTVAVAVPLAFNPWGGNAFELPKALLLRALVLLMGLATLAQAFAAGRRTLQCPPAPLFWPVLAFGLALALATLCSTNPRVSLWGSYERQQGLLTLSTYLALFLLTAAGLRTRAQAQRLWMALVWGSAPVVAYGLLQAARLDPLEWHTDAASPVLSTIGRANFLGSYLVLVVPLTAGQVLAIGSTVSLRQLVPLGLLLMAQLTCLALTQARGAWVGMAVAALVLALVWAAVTRNQRLALTSVVTALLAATFVVLLNLPKGPLAPLAQLPGLERLAALTRTDSGSTAARLTIWRAVLPLIVARPWLGYGPETLRPVFDRIFPPQLVYYQGRRVVDRAHNLWLDLGVSAGLAGIFSFAALLVGFGWLAWHRLFTVGDRKGRLPRDQRDQALWASLTAAIAGHLADLQFSFTLTASATVFWLALALPIPLLLPSVREEKEGEAEKVGWFLIPPALATLALIYLVCLRPLLADCAYWQAQQSTRTQGERLAAAWRAVRLWPLEPEYRLGLARILLQNGAFTEAETQLAAADQLSPADPEVWVARGELYAYWGKIEPSRLAQAEMAYRRALELAPNIATIHTSLGLVLARQGRLEDALAELEHAVALDATDGEAYRYLADLYRMLGQEEKAQWAEKEAKQWSER